MLLLFFISFIINCIPVLQGLKMEICYNKSVEILCNGNKTIDIIVIHYGRFNTLQCETVFDKPCNGSVDARKIIDSNCQNAKSCTVNNAKESIIESGNCEEDSKPNVEITYECKGNNTENISEQPTDEHLLEQKLPYILVGVVLCVVIVIVSAVLVRRRLQNKLKESAEVEYRKQTSTEVNSSDTIDSGKGESHYDEISIRDEESIKTEYNHLKFRASIKTNCGTYNNADIGTYDHAEGVARGDDLNSYTYNHNDINTYNNSGIQRSADCTDYSNHC